MESDRTNKSQSEVFLLTWRALQLQWHGAPQGSSVRPPLFPFLFTKKYHKKKKNTKKDCHCVYPESSQGWRLLKRKREKRDSDPWEVAWQLGPQKPQLDGGDVTAASLSYVSFASRPLWYVYDMRVSTSQKTAGLTVLFAVQKTPTHPLERTPRTANWGSVGLG